MTLDVRWTIQLGVDARVSLQSKQTGTSVTSEAILVNMYGSFGEVELELVHRIDLLLTLVTV